MKIQSVRVERRLQFSIELPEPAASLVRHVLETIEQPTIGVYRSDDPQAFGCGRDEAIEVYQHASQQVAIVDWLSVACQRICVEDMNAEPTNVFGYYRSNISKALFGSWSEIKPPGPAALNSEIVLSHNVFFWGLSDHQQDRDRFCLVVAHELCHAFDAMRFIVPACQDWDSFWRIVLRDGFLCDQARESQVFYELFLDDYGSERELAAIEEFWPSQARQWFTALHDDAVADV